MASLQDQLLKAGLVDEKKAKQVNKAKRKEKKQQPKGHNQVDESKLAAKKSLELKAERAREENRKQQEQAKWALVTRPLPQYLLDLALNPGLNPHPCAAELLSARSRVCSGVQCLLSPAV